MLLVQLVEGVVISHVEILPVVESRAFKRAVGNFKAERSYQVQNRVGSRAGARYIARVLRYFGFYQNYIEHILSFVKILFYLSERTFTIFNAYPVRGVRS